MWPSCFLCWNLVKVKPSIIGAFSLSGSLTLPSLCFHPRQVLVPARWWQDRNWHRPNSLGLKVVIARSECISVRVVIGFLLACFHRCWPAWPHAELLPIGSGVWTSPRSDLFFARRPFILWGTVTVLSAWVLLADQRGIGPPPAICLRRQERRDTNWATRRTRRLLEAIMLLQETHHSIEGFVSLWKRELFLVIPKPMVWKFIIFTQVAHIPTISALRSFSVGELSA